MNSGISQRYAKLRRAEAMLPGACFGADRCIGIALVHTHSTMLYCRTLKGSFQQTPWQFAETCEWTSDRWYEEPEDSAQYEEIEQRTAFAYLLEDAGQSSWSTLLHE